MAYHKRSFLAGVAAGRALAGVLLPQGPQRFTLHGASFLKGLFAGQALRRGVFGGSSPALWSSRAAYHKESFLSGLAAGFMLGGNLLNTNGKIPLHHPSFMKGFLTGQQIRLWDFGGAALVQPAEQEPGSEPYEQKSFLSGLAAALACRGVALYEKTEDDSGLLRRRWMIAADGTGEPVYDPAAVVVSGNAFRPAGGSLVCEGDIYPMAEGTCAAVDVSTYPFAKVTGIAIEE